MNGYSGNYVGQHPQGGDDPCCPGYEDPNPYDVEQPETCILCGELIEIGGGHEVLGEMVCEDCFTDHDNTPEEIEKMIKKLKR